MNKRYVSNFIICLFIFLFNGVAIAQQSYSGKVRGTVRNGVNMPVEGVTIKLVEEPSIQTVTSLDGTFLIKGQVGQHLKIKVPNEGSKRVPIQNDTMKVMIGEDSDISIGYGESRSTTGITSAVGIVKAKDLPQQSSIISSGNMLYGKVPGLIALESSNAPDSRYPDAQATFLVRGQGTFRNNNPLILVDGFQRSINSVVPQAIKSVSVLKDAAALAMYGQRGANGVILVKTKRGSNHPLNVNISLNNAITKPIGIPDFVDATTYARAVNEARGNDGLSQRYSQADVHGFDTGNHPYLYPNVDWFDKVVRNHGARSNYNITFDGGGDEVRYFALVHYMHDNGIFGPVNRNSGYSDQYKTGQVNVRTNLGIDLTDNTLLKLNIGGRLSDLNKSVNGPNDIFDYLYSVPSAAYPVKTPDGNWGGSQIYGNNPVARLTSRGYQSPNFRELLLSGKLRQDLSNWVEGLSAEVDIGYHNYGEYFDQMYRSYQYESLDPVRDPLGNITDTTKTLYGTDTDLQYGTELRQLNRQSDIIGKVNYKHSFGQSKVKGLVLFHQYNQDLTGLNNVTHRRNFAANIHYGYQNTYFVDVSASYSGKNLLPKGNRYNFYPALSAGWVISNEDFLKNSFVLNFLKLRASWGISGNDRVPTNDLYKRSYEFSGADGYRFTDDNTAQSGFREGRLPTSNFTVERAYQSNIGLDARLFNHLYFAGDVFYEHRTNILTDSEGEISDVLGALKPYTTDGVVDNKGFDASLKWQDTIGDVAYHIGGQLSWTKNKIVNENEPYRPYSYLKRTGQSVGQQFGLQAVGFFKNQNDIDNSPTQEFSTVKPGDIKYKDQNGDGIINQNDQVPIGYHAGYPDMYFSASLGVQFKGIALSALFQGTAHMTAYLSTTSVYRPLVSNTNISSYYYNHRWTPQAAGSATLPRLTTEDNDNNFQPNSIWLQDQSYIKLRDLKLSYSLPTSVVHQLHLNKVKIIAHGRNLLSIDDFSVGDPEQFGSEYPLYRYYSLGLNVGF